MLAYLILSHCQIARLLLSLNISSQKIILIRCEDLLRDTAKMKGRKKTITSFSSHVLFE